MDQALASLLSLQVIIYCVVIAVGVQGIRTLVEYIGKHIAHIMPDNYEPWWVWSWRELILPALPVVLGGLVAFLVADYPYPDIFAKTISARVFFGMFAGLLSGYIYPRVKYYYKQFMPKKLDEIVEKNTQLKAPKESSDSIESTKL